MTNPEKTDECYGTPRAMNTTETSQVPRPGMFATVRNRRGIVSAVEPFDGQEGRLHLVHLDYKDDQLPAEERLLWELEPRKVLLEPTALPDALATDPMPVEDFDALLRAARWTAAMPFLDPAGGGYREKGIEAFLNQNDGEG